MLTIEPPPALVIGSITAFMPSQEPTAFTSSTRRKSASAMSAIGANCRIPALLTSTSRWPNASTASATASAQPSSLVTSWCRYRQDSSPSPAATAAPRSSSTSPNTTCAPSATKCRTWDLPMPRAPPVISATFPSSRPMPRAYRRLLLKLERVTVLRQACAGWSYQDVLPSFKRFEDWEDGATAVRGAGGPVKVTRQQDPTPASQAFIEALAATAGVKQIDDYN